MVEVVGDVVFVVVVGDELEVFLCVVCVGVEVLVVGSLFVVFVHC